MPTDREVEQYLIQVRRLIEQQRVVVSGYALDLAWRQLHYTQWDVLEEIQSLDSSSFYDQKPSSAEEGGMVWIFAPELWDGGFLWIRLCIRDSLVIISFHRG